MLTRPEIIDPLFCPLIWSRAIIHIDMNAFFASIEQYDFPQLKNKPVAVTNGEQGTCIITSSYEARAFGVKTGMRLKEAKKLCPRLIQRPTRPKRYAEVSSMIMKTLKNITPDIEIFSVDEAFLDVTHCQKLYGTPVRIAHIAQKNVTTISGVTCSVGVSGDKTTAKYAANLKKPNGFSVIPPWEAKTTLQNIPVTELCGIAKGIGRFLASYGVYTCGDMEKLPIGILAKRFGNLGRRIWLMCQGLDPDPIHTDVAAPKSMGHGKVMPPNTRDKQIILNYLQHMCEKLSARLRRHNLEAKHFFVGLRSHDLGWLGGKVSLISANNDGLLFYNVFRQFLLQQWHEQAVWQIQVTALDPQPTQLQYDLFYCENLQNKKRNEAIDKINQHFGEFTLAPARLLNRSRMPNVIAPAWKPEGHRQSIE